MTTKPLSIKLPDSSIKFVLFQRTEYLQNNFVYKTISLLERANFLYNLSVSIKSFLFSSKIKEEFNKDMDNEFATLKSYLPSNPTSILDIGCGVAGIDVLISKNYNNKIDIFLLDKSHVDKKVYYGFEKRGSFYNSLDVAKQVLGNSGVDVTKIHTQEATDDNKILFEKKFDIVISLISWGFHYPISTYLDEVYNAMAINAILIVDIRKNTGDDKVLEKKFGKYEIILDTNKSLRVLARKS